jgi:hypothetical protein
VWSDSNFQYQDDATGEWHPLSDLKKHWWNWRISRRII